MSELRPHVILIEDEATIRRFVRLALEAEGCEVFEAASLQRGLIEAGTRRPDLVVLDLGLPDGDGVDFIRELRAWSAIPVIVLSARTEEAEKVRALDAGADDYLTIIAIGATPDDEREFGVEGGEKRSRKFLAA